MRFVLLIVVVSLFHSSCNLREREQALQKKETALNEKEQALMLKEKTVLLKEQELLKTKQLLDSSKNADTIRIINPVVAGTWNVNMTCTETTCPGSAVGDARTETWQLSYQGNALLAKAMANQQLVRVYTGFYTGNTIELVEDKTSALAPSMAKMVVRLRITDSTRMEGEREILRDNNCKVVYALQMQKTSE